MGIVFESAAVGGAAGCLAGAAMTGTSGFIMYDIEEEGVEAIACAAIGGAVMGQTAGTVAGLVAMEVVTHDKRYRQRGVHSST